jgi:tetraacyldisaccharide 4'-kinase
VRGLAGSFERSWSGAPGTVPWTKALLPLAGAYALGSAVSRRRARARRRPLEGCRAIAVGNLTVGGTGKSAVARWLAEEAVRAGVRPAVLLRGHGAAAPRPGVLPDFDSYPVETAVARYGDEAVALRRALPREAVVAADPDRWRAGKAARDGYGARLLILDDGWEQGSLAYDELWVALDPSRPAGNGSLLPAGPLRRPVGTMREATRALFVLESPDEEVSEQARAWLARVAPGVPATRMRRTLLEPLPRGAAVGAISGIGSPARLERFLRAAGADLRAHEAFPDHARWSAPQILAALRRARDAGAALAVITEKDEPRWPTGLDSPIPVRVLRTGLVPLDPAGAVV